jgi:predicted oxidoreductase
LVAAIFPNDTAAQVKVTITRYNAAYAANFDEEFGVEHDRMWPLLQAPYYFASFPIIAAAVTTSGVIVDGELRVFKADDYKPIPGLWAVGNTAGGRYAGDYPVQGAAGTSHGTAITFGKSAGYDAAHYTRP